MTKRLTKPQLEALKDAAGPIRHGIMGMGRLCAAAVTERALRKLGLAWKDDSSFRPVYRLTVAGWDRAAALGYPCIGREHAKVTAEADR